MEVVRCSASDINCSLGRLFYRQDSRGQDVASQTDLSCKADESARSVLQCCGQTWALLQHRYWSELHFFFRSYDPAACCIRNTNKHLIELKTRPNKPVAVRMLNSAVCLTPRPTGRIGGHVYSPQITLLPLFSFRFLPHKLANCTNILASM